MVLPSTKIAEVIGNPGLVLLYVVIFGLFALIVLIIKYNQNTIKELTEVLNQKTENDARQSENIENIGKLLHTIFHEILRGQGDVDKSNR